MKEVMAILRRSKIQETKAALDGLGFNAFHLYSVSGRGKQKGILSEIDPPMGEIISERYSEEATYSFIPKRLLHIIVADEDVQQIVDTIIRVNQTGYYGDGKIFVCPIKEVVRIRTSEKGKEALK
ncbi:MAG: P-II family nitrogen regulator [Bacillota bacterium]